MVLSDIWNVPVIRCLKRHRTSGKYRTSDRMCLLRCHRISERDRKSDALVLRSEYRISGKYRSSEAPTGTGHPTGTGTSGILALLGTHRISGEDRKSDVLALYVMYRISGEYRSSGWR